MSPGRLVSLAGLALLLTAVTLLSAVGEPSEPPAGSARSNAPGGRRAALLLLAELGFAPELWDRPPGELLAPSDSHAPPGLLWMPRVPRDFDPELAPDDPLEAARARGPGAWSRYRAFAEAGGVLLLPASEESAAFASAGLGLDPADAEPFELPSELDVSELDPAPLDAMRVLELTDGSGVTLARRIALGEGALVLLAEGDWADNAALGEHGHALLLVRLLERVGQGGPLYFDEGVFTAARGGDSALALAFGAGGRFTWHLLALLALAVWAAAWVREFPRDPEPLEALSPLARAEATAAWLARHGRFDALARMLRDGTLAALGGETGEERIERGAVAALAEGHGRAGEAERWIELLAARPVADREGLAALDRELRGLLSETTARGATTGTHGPRARAGRRED